MTRSIRSTTVAALVVAAAAPGQTALAQQDLRMPDTREAARTSSLAGSVSAPRQDLRSPDTRDAARGIYPGDVRQTPVLVRTGPNGFDWGDAGIGAAGGLAIIALLSGTGVLVSQRRRHRVHLPVA